MGIAPSRCGDSGAVCGMARLGINLPVIERVLNHVSGSFAGIVGVISATTSRMRSGLR